MFYVYTLLIPLLILGANYLATKPKPRKVSAHINVLLKALPHEWGYMFFLYYLETEKDIDIGWGALTVFFFLVPITVIVLIRTC